MMGGMMMGGGIFGLLIIGLVIYLLMRLFNNSNGYNPNGNNYTRSNDALEILKERFARGEISEEEYERKIKILKD